MPGDTRGESRAATEPAAAGIRDQRVRYWNSAMKNGIGDLAGLIPPKKSS
jgi:hypothetical protein